jgi:hypothetical protein
LQVSNLPFTCRLARLRQINRVKKLFGSIEYRWTSGSKPGLFVAGIPAKLDVNQHGFSIGFDYKY